MVQSSIIDSIRRQIISCEAQLEHLRQQLAEAERYQHQQQEREGLRQTARTFSDPLTHDMSYGIHDDFRSEVFAALSHGEEKPLPRKWPLDRAEYMRYGRQLIMPEIGLQGTSLAS